MRLALRDDRVKFYIGDVRDYGSVDDAVRGVDYVFHAAALKQVPSCEFYPMEAVKTNVLGAENVLRASIAHGVSRCVVSFHRQGRLSRQRHGSFQGDDGKGHGREVAPQRLQPHRRVRHALRQRHGLARLGDPPCSSSRSGRAKPLTVTDPAMTRFLMSLEESVDLVLYAFNNAQPGDIFVQKAPASTVGDLAQALRELMAADTPVKVIGTRHGEKLYESLVSREEMVRAEDHGGYYRIPADARDLNYDKYFVEGEREIEKIEDYTSHNTRRLDVEGVKQVVQTLDIVREALARR
jgi:UDP-N-acetylglucosamine 4,6-dehydratase